MHYKRGSRLTDEHVPEFHELNNGKIARDMFSYEHIPCYSFISASSLSKLAQQAGQAFVEVPPGGLEVAGVPRVRHFLAAAPGVVEHERDFAVGIAVRHAAQVAEVCVVHADDVVVLVILAADHAVRGVPGAAYAVLGELPARGRVDAVAHFLAGRGRRRNVEFILAPGLLYHVLEHKLRHRTPAYVAVADE